MNGGNAAMENENNVLLSIIIPAYNVEKYIAQCLDSIFSGMSENIKGSVEVIVVNDGSTDSTLDILRKYEKLHGIVLIDQKNEGMSYARNAGIRAARGKYLQFVDSDDYLAPDAIAKIVKFIAENKDFDIAEFESYILTIDLNLKKYANGGALNISGRGPEIYVKWAKYRHPVVWTKLVSRRMIIENDLFFYPGIVAQDSEWTPRIYSFAGKILYLDDYLYIYRVRSGSVTSVRTRKRYFDILKICDSLMAFSKLPRHSAEFSTAIREKCSDCVWGALKGIKRNGRWDEELISEITKRIHIIDYSVKFNRRYILRHIVKLFGIKTFYMVRYPLGTR